MAPVALNPTPTRAETRGLARGGSLYGTHMLRAGAFFVGNAEPSLDEVMDDPMVRRLMDRDGVAKASLQSLINEVRLRLR